MFKLFKKKKPQTITEPLFHPIDQLPIDKIVLLWVDTYDCGWSCDLGWKDKDGKFWSSTPNGSMVQSCFSYTHFNFIVYPEEK